ncbi:15608_t:CDS:1 [Acaulospora colombiana]|uniref:15608_t:CDS:1 n=1 Tax=Acaulospora colombiana TaxID=27376 RepID=A0ACA9PYY3_9GLOM|nr:15608_t:CDS:1 [Acaulospora colombiana]
MIYTPAMVWIVANGYPQKMIVTRNFWLTLERVASFKNSDETDSRSSGGQQKTDFFKWPPLTVQTPFLHPKF